MRVLRIREKIVSEGEWQILKPMRSQSRLELKMFVTHSYTEEFDCRESCFDGETEMEVRLA